MTVSPAVLLLSLAIGVPLMLLALGVLYHGYLLSLQPRRDPLDIHVEALATESAEDLLVSLQEAVDQLQGQMARQRDSLASLLSDQRTSLTLATVGGAEGRPMAAGEHVTAADASASEVAPLPVRVGELAEQGLSDRAIARQLHVGLEEVRIARMRGGRA